MAIPAGFSCDQQYTCMRCTLSLCQAIFTDKTDSDFHYRYSFPTRGKHETGHTHRMTSCGDEHRIQLPGYNFCTIQPFQRSTLFFRGLLKLLAFELTRSFLTTVSLTTQASPEFKRTFCQNYSSRPFSVSQDDRQIKVQLITVLSTVYSIRYSSLYYSISAPIF